MIINQYLIVSQTTKPWNAKVKLSKTLKGNMPANAIAIKLNIIIPDAIFKKPQLEATIKINEADVSKPIINAEVLDNIKMALNQNLGIDLKIEVVQNEEKK